MYNLIRLSFNNVMVEEYNLVIFVEKNFGWRWKITHILDSFFYQIFLKAIDEALFGGSMI